MRHDGIQVLPGFWRVPMATLESRSHTSRIPRCRDVSANPTGGAGGNQLLPQAIIARPISYFRDALGIRISKSIDDFDEFEGAALRLNGELPFALKHYAGYPDETTTIYLPCTIRDVAQITTMIRRITKELHIARTWIACLLRRRGRRPRIFVNGAESGHRFARLVARRFCGHRAACRGQDLYPPAERGRAGQSRRMLCQGPDRRHAQRLSAAGREAAAGDRSRPSRHRILVRRPAARRGRKAHAAVRRARLPPRQAPTCSRRPDSPVIPHSSRRKPGAPPWCAGPGCARATAGTDKAVRPRS
jgi:hypothetical protein